MSPLLCQHCRTPVSEVLFNSPEFLPCPRCQTSLLVRVFPAYTRPLAAGLLPEALSSEEDASCFYHPAKKAVVPCADCGRFLCALCDLQIGSRHVCPACTSAGAGTGASAGTGGKNALLPVGKISRGWVLHDNIALSLSLLPLLIWPFTLLTAPVALFLSLYYWNEPPRNPLGRTRMRLVFAALFSTATLAGWGFGLYSLFHHAA